MTGNGIIDWKGWDMIGGGTAGWKGWDMIGGGTAGWKGWDMIGEEKRDGIGWNLFGKGKGKDKVFDKGKGKDKGKGTEKHITALYPLARGHIAKRILSFQLWIKPFGFVMPIKGLYNSVISSMLRPYSLLSFWSLLDKTFLIYNMAKGFYNSVISGTIGLYQGLLTLPAPHLDETRLAIRRRFPFGAAKGNILEPGQTLPAKLSPKKPENCPYCSSGLTIRHGKRKIKRSIVQIRKCLSCLKYFSDRALRHKSYDARTILRAVTLYNLGHTYSQVIKEMSTRHRQKIPASTLKSWLKEYSRVCTFARLREEAMKMCGPDGMVFSKSLQHNQIYKFQLHRAKLELLKGYLPEIKFNLLKDYLERIPTNGFPHHIFRPKAGEAYEELPRSSRISFQSLDFIRTEKQNLANTLAGLALNLAKDNKDRHQAVQNFMIANDSVTVACEVPVYLTRHDMDYFRSKGFILNFENQHTPITGHIDILQIRNGMIHILDYKPEAAKANAAGQVSIYALALASRTRLAVKDFRCAWFDEKSCHEFFPLHAFYRRDGGDAGCGKQGRGRLRIWMER